MGHKREQPVSQLTLQVAGKTTLGIARMVCAEALATCLFLPMSMSMFMFMFMVMGRKLPLPSMHGLRLSLQV